MSELVIIIESRENWTNAEKGRRPQYKNKNKEEGGKEGGEEGGREGGGEGAGRAEIAEIAEITVAEGHRRSGEGSKRRRGSLRREENYRREESEELEGGRAEKEVGKNKIAEIAEIAEITVTKGHGRHERLEEGSKGVKGSVRREEYDRREESEELEERRIEKEVGKKRKRIIEISEGENEEEDKEEDKEEESEERINNNKKRLEKGKEKAVEHEKNVDMEDTEGWILENNSILNDNENDFLSFEMNLMNFLSEEETPIASSSKNITQKTTMNRIKGNTNKKGIELNNNKGDEGDEDEEGDEDNEGDEGDEDDEGDEGEISNNNILSNSSRLQNRRKRKASVLLKTSKGKKLKTKKSKTVAALRTSFVWDFFITDHDIETDVVYAICQVKDCTRKYAHHGSTTNYTKHLRDDHHITEASLSSKTPEEIKNLKQSKQQSIVELLSRPLNPRKQKLLNQDLVKFIVGTRQPLSIVENNYFKNYSNALNSQFSIPCINTVKNLIDLSYNYMKRQLKDTIINSIDYIHLTFDLWSSKAHDSYLGITAHWINKEFEICNMVLNVGEIPYPHTGVEISLHVSKVLDDWNLEDKIIIIVTDNGSNVKSAVTRLGKDWIPCAAHTLQLSVNKGLKIIDPLITKVKNLIIFLGSDKRRQQLRRAQVMCNQIQENETVEIIKPIDIRWNSFYNALVRLYELKNSIKWLANNLENSHSSIDVRDFNIMDQLLPTSTEWKTIQDLTKLLASAEQATRLLGGENYTTLALTAPIIDEVIRNFKNIKSKNTIITNITISNICNTILDDLETRWNIPNNYGVIASFLDPRFKNLNFCSQVSIYFFN